MRKTNQEMSHLWLQFNPQVRHRPSFVLSLGTYNRAGNLMLCYPMNSHKKGSLFEVVINDGPNRIRVVLPDRVIRVDWNTCNAVKKGTISPAVLSEPWANSRRFCNRW